MSLKSRFLVTTLLFTILIGGCATFQSTQNEVRKVTVDQVKAFQNRKVERKVDIYIPLKEQYANSNHSKSLKTLLNSKSTIKPQCYQCMSTEYNIAPWNQKPDPKNVKLSITCAVCHVLTDQEFKLRSSPLETCTGCHHNSGAIVPGLPAHHTQKEMFLGYGAIGVPKIPDTKYKSGLTCIECHMPNEAHTFEGKTPAAAIKEHRESICVMCHADQSEEQFARKVDDMQSGIRNTCDQLAKSLVADEEKIKKNKALGINMDQAQQIYNIVYTNLSFVTADKSMGIHNFQYTTEILKYSKARQMELDKLLK